MLKSFDFALDVPKVTKKKIKFDKLTVNSYQDLYLSSIVCYLSCLILFRDLTLCTI